MLPYDTFELVEALVVVIPAADSMTPPVKEVGWAIDKEMTPPPVLASVPTAVMVPFVVVPAATLRPPVILIPPDPESVIAPVAVLPVEVTVTPPDPVLVMPPVTDTAPAVPADTPKLPVPVMVTPVTALIVAVSDTEVPVVDVPVNETEPAVAVITPDTSFKPTLAATPVEPLRVMLPDLEVIGTLLMFKPPPPPVPDIQILPVALIPVKVVPSITDFDV